MNLYQMVYLREGKPRGTTFAHKSAQSAGEFAEVWTKAAGVQLLTVAFLRALHPELRLS